MSARLTVEAPLPAGVYELVVPTPEAPHVPPPPAPKPHPTGKGMYVWNVDQCAGGSPQRMAQMAVQAGLRHVVLKIADGWDAFPRVPRRTGPVLDLAPWVSALAAAGVEVWGWSYVYGEQPEREADIAAQQCRRYELAGFVIDAEHEYKAWPDRKARGQRFVDRLALNLNGGPLGLSSYRYPVSHPEIPWDEFLSRCTFHYPQVYPLGATSPTAFGLQLTRSVAQLVARRDLPVIPVGPACPHPVRVAASSSLASLFPVVKRYDDGTVDVMWRPTVAQLDDLHATAWRLNLAGVSWWSWEHAEAEAAWWQAITRHQWS